MKLVKKGDTVTGNSHSYSRRGQYKRCFACGRKGRDVDLVYYKSSRKNLNHHYLCDVCKGVYLLGGIG